MEKSILKKKAIKLINIFCDSNNIENESDVEALFLDRLLNSLNYPDDKILRKKSLQRVVIGRGSKKENYKPDYILLNSKNDPVIVIDAKSPNESLEDYTYQVSSYALSLNQKFTDKNPVMYTILTNGHKFIVYSWDSEQPIFYLEFEDFIENNAKFLELKSNLSFTVFNQILKDENSFEFYKPNITSLNKVFNECHNIIWKKEKIGPTDAFYEFCKIMFIKIREDDKIHSTINEGKLPSENDFIFSTKWLDKQSSVEPNPFDRILFKQIQDTLEEEIRKGRKKRIFEKDEGILLKPSTIYEVVKRLENYDLWGIDEDLNGRMFETFLNATVRGEELGQFFTPRGVVHYMADTAPFFISTDISKPVNSNVPFVLDGCCGSGGFLIESMAILINKLNKMTNLTDIERSDYEIEIKNNHLYGFEANPKISRISRLNMYLHGDGGSKIFKIEDSLDKELLIEIGTNYEEKNDMIELKKDIENGLNFDIILTNPPFSMKYSSKDKKEKKVLKQYKIAKNSSGKMSNSEKSNVLFIERYLDFLKDGTGELITIIDDTVLNGQKSQKYRDFILENYIIIQIISLPFNTFFKADANIKTSIIHLRKKRPGESQGNIFMGITNNIGHDDHCISTPDRNNLDIVSRYFKKWRIGEKIEETIIHNEDPNEPLGCPLQIFELSSNNINTERLDAFYYSIELKQLKKNVLELSKKNQVKIYRGGDFEMIPSLKKNEINEKLGNIYKYIEIGDVTIDGTIIKFREDYINHLPTRARLLVRKNDIVFAKNNSSRGTTVQIPDWFEDNLVTTGFIGIRPKNKEESLILWNIMESEFFRKQIYYLSITASQPEIRENIFKEEIIIPWPNNDKNKNNILQNSINVENAKNNLMESIKIAKNTLDELIDN